MSCGAGSLAEGPALPLGVHDMKALFDFVVSVFAVLAGLIVIALVLRLILFVVFFSLSLLLISVVNAFRGAR